MRYLVLAAGLVVCALPIAADAQSTGTTSTVSGMDASSTGTGSMPPRTRTMTTSTVERLWSRLGEQYRQAGVPEDRIQKLKELDMKAVSAQASGEKVDLVEIRQERDKLITPEEKEKLQKLRADRASALRAQRQGAVDSGTSPTSQPSNP
ncbi:MAG: hypothetical protein ACR2IE_12675 [Candidatus Sumerlaeaceae bacterium]